MHTQYEKQYTNDEPMMNLSKALADDPIARQLTNTIIVSHINRRKAWLNAREARELARQGILRDAELPRPPYRIVSNLTTTQVTIYHRTRQSPLGHPGEWTPCVYRIPTTPRVAHILLARCGSHMGDNTRRILGNVINGMKPHQKVRKSITQAEYA